MRSDEAGFSSSYSVRKMTVEDKNRIYDLCSGNPLYYRHCPPFVTLASIEDDLKALPPNISADRKHYVGFFDGDSLVAVLDLIDGYPREDIAFIGFFMTDASVQGRGMGSFIITELCASLKKSGFQRLRLAWVKDNPQASRFWQKNGLIPFGETANNGPYLLTLAEKEL